MLPTQNRNPNGETIFRVLPTIKIRESHPIYGLQKSELARCALEQVCKTIFWKIEVMLVNGKGQGRAFATEQVRLREKESTKESRVRDSDFPSTGSFSRKERKGE
uniref:Ribosomal protein S3 n=1 Tax=Trichogramma kaykai TaxID=54128 RepID=A0ABD2WTN1_9HYME